MEELEKVKKELDRVIHNLIQTEECCKLNEKLLKENSENMQKIKNLSKFAWEQVYRNPQEASEIFKMIYKIASNEEVHSNKGKLFYAKISGK